MKVFRDLTIDGATDPSRYEKLGAAIAAHLPAHWKRDEERERDNDRLLQDMTPFFVFERAEHGGVPRAGLVLICRDSLMEVANVVPIDRSELTRDQYNAVLCDFVELGAKAAAEELGLKMHLTPDDRAMTDWLSEVTFRKLRQFDALANKSTGSTHPRDRDRWMDFIISAHLEEAPLDTDMLKRWLTEESHWDEETASDLVIEYEFGRGLLNRAT
jgi:hypothetical protein